MDIVPARPYVGQRLDWALIDVIGTDDTGADRALERLASALATSSGSPYETLRIELACYGGVTCQGIVSGAIDGARQVDNWLFESTGDFRDELTLVPTETKLLSIPPDTLAALVSLVDANPVAARRIADLERVPDVTWSPTKPGIYTLEYRSPFSEGPGEGPPNDKVVTITVDGPRRSIEAIDERLVRL